MLQGVVNVGAVDMTEHQSVGAPYGIQGFPTIKIFGSNKQKPEDYKGDRFSCYIITVNAYVQYASKSVSIYTHTHPFNGPFSGTTRVSQYQKGKTNLDFTEARDSEWQ